MTREKPLSADRVKQIADRAAGGFVDTQTKTGRPSQFNQDVADVICERIVEGQSLREIVRDPVMPASSTVFKWLSQFLSFAEQYTRAREAQADTIFDEILDIADNAQNDWMERAGEDGGTSLVENRESIRRAQLRIDARKWMAGKLRPKKYSDKLELEHSGKDGAPLVPIINVRIGDT